MHRSTTLAMAAMAILLCATVAHAGMFDDTDRRPKVLWLPVQSGDCPATCSGVGLVAVTVVASELNRAACAAFPPQNVDDDIYMGTWRRQSSGNVCQGADDDDDGRARTFTAGYFCACLPRKAGTVRSMDAFWKPKTNACGTGFFTEPNLCLATLNNQPYIGQREDDDDECVFFVAGELRGRRTRTYNKLCVPQRFGYLAFDKYDD